MMGWTPLKELLPCPVCGREVIKEHGSGSRARIPRHTIEKRIGAPFCMAEGRRWKDAATAPLAPTAPTEIIVKCETGKLVWLTRESAEQIARNTTDANRRRGAYADRPEDRIQCRAYRCHRCGHWHVTSSPPMF